MVMSEVLIGDEPTGDLDTRTAAEMFDLERRLDADDSMVLYVTHDTGLARTFTGEAIRYA